MIHGYLHSAPRQVKPCPVAPGQGFHPDLQGGGAYNPKAANKRAATSTATATIYQGQIKTRH
jgi:hypothetical protein